MASQSKINALKSTFNNVCDEYLRTFCENFELRYEQDSWVAGECGTIACVCDYYFDFQNVIKFCVDNNIKKWDVVLKWYDYTLDASELGISIPNFRSWYMGCPRLDDKTMKRLLTTKRDLEKQIEEFKVEEGLF